MNITRISSASFAAVLVAALAAGGLVWATPSSGTSSVLIGPRAAFEAFKVSRRNPSRWAVKVEAKDGLHVATQVITFAPHGKSGWHTHPGPVFIAVREGAVAFYEKDCSRTLRVAGEGFLDTGDHAHFAVNESDVPAVNVVTYFLPPDATALRVDEPTPPATCPLE
jgi:quercetin dioxygenase-like cupin family protein